MSHCSKLTGALQFIQWLPTVSRVAILVRLRLICPSWLEQVIATCIDDRYDELTDLNRALQFDDTVKFPERSNKRSTQIPWSFLVDQMNVPDVYWWTFGKERPGDRPQGADDSQ